MRWLRSAGLGSKARRAEAYGAGRHGCGFALKPIKFDDVEGLCLLNMA